MGVPVLTARMAANVNIQATSNRRRENETLVKYFNVFVQYHLYARVSQARCDGRYRKLPRNVAAVASSRAERR